MNYDYKIVLLCYKIDLVLVDLIFFFFFKDLSRIRFIVREQMYINQKQMHYSNRFNIFKSRISFLTLLK